MWTVHLKCDAQFTKCIEAFLGEQFYQDVGPQYDISLGHQSSLFLTWYDPLLDQSLEKVGRFNLLGQQEFVTF